MAPTRKKSARKSARSKKASAKRAERVVYFLGAGASVPLGFPTTPGFLPRIWKELHTAGDAGSWRRWAGKERPVDRDQLLHLFRTVFPGLGEQDLDGAGSIIDVVSMVEQLINDGLGASPALAPKRLLEARATLTKAINGVLRGPNTKHRRTYTERWVQGLLSRATESEASRVTIVSTNYDTTIELPLFRRLREHGVTIGRAVDMGMTWRDSSAQRLHVRPADARLAIFKLHGSLNWLRCEVCGHVTMNVRSRIAAFDSWDHRAPRGWNVCWCNGQLRGILVTPSVVRDVRDATLLGIWNAAMEDLRLADEWVFVGYSLPAEDIAIRSVILRAWHARIYSDESTRPGKKPRVRVVQYEPDSAGETDTFRRYRLLFPEDALADGDYDRRGVEDFVQELGTLTKTETTRRLKKYFGGRAPVRRAAGPR